MLENKMLLDEFYIENDEESNEEYRRKINYEIDRELEEYYG